MESVSGWRQHCDARQIIAFPWKVLIISPSSWIELKGCLWRLILSSNNMHLTEEIKELIVLYIMHNGTHSKERAYNCVQCNKSFIQYGNLTQHMITQSEVKSHTCSECKKPVASIVIQDNTQISVHWFIELYRILWLFRNDCHCWLIKSSFV